MLCHETRGAGVCVSLLTSMKSVSMCPCGEKGCLASAPRTGQRWMGVVSRGTVVRVNATMSAARSMGSEGFMTMMRLASTSDRRQGAGQCEG